MTATRPEPIKIFVTDIDGCALEGLSKRPDLLSQTLIDIARGNNYAAMYGCTHRTYEAFKYCTYFQDHINLILEKKKNSSEPLDPFVAFTTKVMANFSRESQLECLAVSTPDDHYCEGADDQKCGSGFKNIIEIYEAELIANNNLDDIMNGKSNFVTHDFECEQKKLSWERDRWAFDSKNFQLRYIMRHAIKKYGNTTPIEIHFFDDVYQYCHLISTMYASLPANITIKSFQHSPDENIHADINSPVVTISGTDCHYSSTAGMIMQMGGLQINCVNVEISDVEYEDAAAEADDEAEDNLQFPLHESDEEANNFDSDTEELIQPRSRVDEYDDPLLNEKCRIDYASEPRTSSPLMAFLKP